MDPSDQPGTVAGLYAGKVMPMPGDGRPTAIFKDRLTDTQRIGSEGLEADSQADRKVHGGPEKALHQFSYSSLEKLQEKFPDRSQDFVAGALGENISEALMDEGNVHIGDVYSLGTAKIQVCQPRTPCWKVDTKFDQPGLASFLMQNGIAGWYYRVIETGEVKQGDAIKLIERFKGNLSIENFWAQFRTHRPALTDLEQLRAQAGLSSWWVEKISGRMEWLRRNPQR